MDKIIEAPAVYSDKPIYWVDSDGMMHMTISNPLIQEINVTGSKMNLFGSPDQVKATRDLWMMALVIVGALIVFKKLHV